MRTRWGLLSLLLLPLLTAPQADAVVGDAWIAAGCPPEYVDSPANGVESTVIPVTGGRLLRLTYGWEAGVTSAPITVTMVDGDCRPIGTPAVVQSGAALAVPVSTAWLVIQHPGKVGFRCTVS